MTTNILNKVSQALLRELIQQIRAQLNRTDTALFETYSTLSRTMYPILWEQIDKIITFRAETDTEIRTERRKRITEQKSPTANNAVTTEFYTAFPTKSWIMYP
ncbi:hypothetical protein Trydic_g10898 [Trypoxylus dichotomus]